MSLDRSPIDIDPIAEEVLEEDEDNSAEMDRENESDDLSYVRGLLDKERERFSKGDIFDVYFDAGFYAGLSAPLMFGGHELYQAASTSAELQTGMIGTAALYGAAYAGINRLSGNALRRYRKHYPYDD